MSEVGTGNDIELSSRGTMYCTIKQICRLKYEKSQQQQMSVKHRQSEPEFEP
jgi:hypothetical protein